MAGPDGRAAAGRTGQQLDQPKPPERQALNQVNQADQVTNQALRCLAVCDVCVCVGR